MCGFVYFPVRILFYNCMFFPLNAASKTEIHLWPLCVFNNPPFDTVWIGKAHKQTPTASPTFAPTCVLIPLAAFSHCLGRVKTGWLISLCPLFSSCAGSIQSDWCPSDHLCTAQELDVPGSVCVVPSSLRFSSPLLVSSASVSPTSLSWLMITRNHISL